MMGTFFFRPHSLSQAFREAADEVPPSVLMIRRIPLVAVRSPNRGPSPDEGPENSPFGDLNRIPELRRFFENQPVNTVEDFHAALNDSPPEEGVLLPVRNPQGSRFVVIEAECRQER